MDKTQRMAFILISFPTGSHALLEVFSLMSKFETFFLGSINVNISEGGESAIGILIKANTDQMGAITGPIGKINGVTVKSAILPNK